MPPERQQSPGWWTGDCWWIEGEQLVLTTEGRLLADLVVRELLP